MKNPWVIIGVITLILFGGAFWYASVSAEKNNQGVEVVAHIKGNQEATVKLVEYSDFQCPACAAFQPAINEVLSSYGDEVSLEYRHLPLPIHRNAVPASLAAEAAGQQGMFFEYHDLLFENQAAWATAATPQPLFLQYADELGLDTDTFRRHMNASVLRDHVQAHYAEGRDRGVSGTPTFFLNGERMTFQTYQEFIDQVAAATGATSTPVTEPAVQFGI